MQKGVRKPVKEMFVEDACWGCSKKDNRRGCNHCKKNNKAKDYKKKNKKWDDEY